RRRDVERDVVAEDARTERACDQLAQRLRRDRRHAIADRRGERALGAALRLVAQQILDRARHAADVDREALERDRRVRERRRDVSADRGYTEVAVDARAIRVDRDRRAAADTRGL